MLDLAEIRARLPQPTPAVPRSSYTLAAEWDVTRQTFGRSRHMLSDAVNGDDVYLMIEVRPGSRVEWHCSPPGYDERDYASGTVLVEQGAVDPALDEAKQQAFAAWARWVGEDTGGPVPPELDPEEQDIADLLSEVDRLAPDAGRWAGLREAVRVVCMGMGHDLPQTDGDLAVLVANALQFTAVAHSISDTSTVPGGVPWPVKPNAASMTPERREWMSAVLEDQERHVPGTVWHEWLGSALAALDNAVADTHGYRRAVEEALGVVDDPVNHDQDWAHRTVLGLRELGNGVAPEAVDRLLAGLPSAKGGELAGAARLEWVHGNESLYNLVVHFYGVRANLMLVFVMPKDAGCAYVSSSNDLVGPVSKEDVMLQAKERVRSARLPFDVPPLPGA